VAARNCIQGTLHKPQHEDSSVDLCFFSAAAAQFQRQRAFLGPPYDIREVVEVIRTANGLSLLDRWMRRHRLRENVLTNNIGTWGAAFWNAAFSKNLTDFTSLKTVQFHEKTPPAPEA